MIKGEIKLSPTKIALNVVKRAGLDVSDRKFPNSYHAYFIRVDTKGMLMFDIEKCVERQSESDEEFEYSLIWGAIGYLIEHQPKNINVELLKYWVSIREKSIYRVDRQWKSKLV